MKTSQDRTRVWRRGSATGTWKRGPQRFSHISLCCMAIVAIFGFGRCRISSIASAFVGCQLPAAPRISSTRRPRHGEIQSLTSRSATSESLNNVVIQPLKLASLGLGLLKAFFSFESKAQALFYDKDQIRATLQKEISSSPVVIYTYSLSPFSTEAIKILQDLGADYKEIELAPEWFVMLGEGAAKRAELGEMYGRTSMPHIFIGGESIGGLIDGDPGLVPLYESGELTSRLKQAGAIPDEGLFGFFLYPGMK